MKLRTLPMGIFDNLYDLETLDLGENQLANGLTNGVFRNLYSLKTLSLDNNNLKTLDTVLFDDLKNLRTIDLSGNELSSLDPQLFHDSLDLELLDLSSNKFTTFDLQQTTFSKTLVELDMDDNQLVSIRVTEDLEELYVENNQLTAIEVDNSPSYNLRSLSIANNKFTELDSLYRFNNLEELDASYNAELKVLELGRISKAMSVLEVLNVSNCIIDELNLAEIEVHAFLELLDVSGNKLPSLELDAYRYFPAVESFIFGGNAFEKFSIEEVLSSFKDLEMIGLDGTTWEPAFLDELESYIQDRDVRFWHHGTAESPTCTIGRVSQLFC
uniref:Leucine rich immune protein (Coil-less) n=1 Tax=Anopheles maculatus TaxID=74869 RepID=A0A182SVI3_9DIPT